MLPLEDKRGAAPLRMRAPPWREAERRRQSPRRVAEVARWGQQARGWAGSPVPKEAAWPQGPAPHAEGGGHTCAWWQVCVCAGGGVRRGHPSESGTAAGLAACSSRGAQRWAGGAALGLGTENFWVIFRAPRTAFSVAHNVALVSFFEPPLPSFNLILSWSHKSAAFW